MIIVLLTINATYASSDNLNSLSQISVYFLKFRDH